jgi:excisionase family DNA binding protein
VSVASRHLSPVAVARQLGVRDAKVVGWIKRGELRAANLASVTGGKPRYRISPEALREFLAGREVVPGGRPAVRRRRRKDESVIEFF